MYLYVVSNLFVLFERAIKRTNSVSEDSKAGYDNTQGYNECRYVRLYVRK